MKESVSECSSFSQGLKECVSHGRREGMNEEWSE